MADREQIWKIVADFGSLTRNARNAAKAVDELDASRKRAEDSAKIPLVNDADVERLDHMNKAIKTNVEYLRASNAERGRAVGSMKHLKKGHTDTASAMNKVSTALERQDTKLKNSISAHEESAKATDDHARSMHEFAGGVDSAKDSLGHLNAESRQNASLMSSNNKAVKASTGGHRALRHSVTDVTARTTQLGASTSFLTKAFADIIPVSRSWAMFMKMLPLTAVTSGLGALIPAVGSLTAGLVGLVGTLGPVVGLLGALPTAAVAAGGAIGGLVTGMGGIFGALGQWKKMNEANDKEQNKALGTQKKSIKADKDRQKSIRNATRALDKARRDQARAARGIKDAQKEVGLTKRDNARGLKQAKDNVSETAAENLQKVQEAEERLANTRESGASKVRSAEDLVTKAQERAKKAQQGINQAREQAAKALEDYRLRLRGAALDEEGAVLALQKARAQMAAISVDPASSALDQKAASLAVRQAELAVEEARASSSDLEADAEDARKRGVEGSKLVVAAKQEEVDANKSVKEAQDDLSDSRKDSLKDNAKAEKDLAEVRKDAVKDAARAQEQLRDEQERAAKATESAQRSLEDANQSYADGAERIRDLQENLADANEALEDNASATSAAATAAAAYEAALAKLPPSARLVVEELVSISEAWEKVSYRAQDAISPGLLSFLKDMSNVLLPRIADFLVRMAGGAGAWFDALGQVLTRRKNLKNLNDMFEDSYDLMSDLGVATLNVIEWLLGLGAAARRSGLTKWIGDVLKQWTGGWADSVGSEEAIDATADSFKNSMKWAEKWGDTLKGVWRLLRTYMKAFRPLGGRLLDSLTRLTNKWSDWIESPSGKKKIDEWDRLADINLSGLSDMLGTITSRLFGVGNDADKTRDKLETFWRTLNGSGGPTGGGFINKLADLLGLVDETMITNIMGLGEGIMDVLIALGQGGGIAVVEGIVSAFGELAEIASTLFRVLPGLAPLVVGLMAAFSTKKIIVAMGALTGATPFFKAVEAATMKGYKGPDLARASMGEAMGFGNFQKGKQIGPWGDDTIRGGTIPAGYYPQPAKQPIPAGYYPQPAKTPIPAGYYPQPATQPLPAPKPAPYVPMSRKERSVTRKAARAPMGGSYAADQKAFEAQAKLDTDAINRKTVATGKYRSAVTKVGGAWSAVGGIVKGIVIIAAISAAIGLLSDFVERLGGVAATAGDAEIAMARLNKAIENSSGPQEITDSFDTLFDGIKGPIAGVYDLDKALKAIKIGGADGVFDAVMAKLTGFTGRLENARAGMGELDTQLIGLSTDQAAEAFEVVSKKFEEAEIPLNEMIELFPEYAKQVNLASIEAGTGAIEGENLALAMKGQYKPLTEAQEAAEKKAGADEKAATSADNAAEATERNKKALEDSIQKYDDATDAVNALTEAQDKQQGNFISSIQARDQYNTAQEAFIAGLKESKTGIEGDTAANRANRDAMFEVATSAREAAQALIDNGEGADAANASMSGARQAFIDAHDQMGLTATEAAKLADDMNLIPNYTEIGVVMPNAKLTQEQIDNLQTSMLLFDEETKLKVNTTAIEEGGVAAEALVEYITNANPNLKIGVTIDDSPSPATGAWAKYNAAKKKSKSGLNSSIWGRNYAEGGPVNGPGTGTSDSIAARLSDGEYVIKAKSAKKIGYDNLDRANRTGNITRKYAKGGRVQKFAKGGKATGGSGVMAGLSIQLTGLNDLANSTGTAIAGWGNKFAGGWAGLWGKIVAITKVSTAQVTAILGAPWARAWTTAFRTTASNTALMATSTVSSTTGMNRSLGGTMSLLSAPWSLKWQGAKTTALTALAGIVSGTITMSGAMGVAMNRFMTAMKTPIKSGLDFINGTLGAAVNAIGSFYGVKEKSPFPIKTPGFSEGGWTGSGSKYTPAGVVHADEYVISKASRRKIERTNPGALDHMNRKGQMPGYATGGRVHPVSSGIGTTYAGHTGRDFGRAYNSGYGTTVRAAGAGTITRTAKLAKSYGWHIRQRLDEGLNAVYAHLSHIGVTAGQRVKAGEPIGRVGNTGNSQGAHLHFGINESPASTVAFLRGAAVTKSSGGGAGASMTPVTPDPSILTRLTGGLAKFMSTTGKESPWGSMVGSAVSKSTQLAMSKFSEMAKTVAGSAPSLSSLAPASSFAGEYDKVQYGTKKGSFTRKFALQLQKAEQAAGVKFNISQGGFRPANSRSGTSHQGDAVDIAGPVTRSVVMALRANGIAAWERGPKEGYSPHIHGVPLPGYGRGAGSAPWQAQEYLKGLGGLKGGQKSKYYAEGGWTGPGSKYKPAGVVHADEYVINKSSRRRIEKTNPGVLDHMNRSGSMPGYATGGKVGDPKKFIMPRTLKGFTPYFSYMQKAEGMLWKRPAETIKHLQVVENLMAHEGLLSRERANGMWDKYDTAAWKSWQKKNKQPDNGHLDAKSMQLLMSKYNVKYNASTPFVPGMAQPSRTDVVQGSLDSSNKQMVEYMGYLNKLKGMGFSHVFDHMKQLGPNGIPDEYKDTPNPLTGIQMAKSFAGNIASARRYEEALKKASVLDGTSTSLLDKKLAEMLDLITYGVDGPLGLQTAARSLGVSVDTAAMLFNKLSSRGSFKNMSGSKTNRLRGDVADFGNLFKFSKGGIVPGFGNTDSVHALLTPGELVVPKNIVNNMFSPAPSVTPFLDLTARSANRTDTKDGSAGNTYQFNTNVYNPVAEESSVSVQRRVKSAASLGLLGGRK